ncbi:hypothetical protein D9M68_864280 [compost metagenome]
MGMVGELLDLVDKGHAFRAAGGNGAGNAGQGQHEFGLAHDVAFGDVDFHMQRRFDAERQGFGEVILKRPGLVDGGGATEPGIAETLGIDQVQMGIENTHSEVLPLVPATGRSSVLLPQGPSVVAGQAPLWHRAHHACRGAGYRGR